MAGKVRIICVGKVKERYISDAVNEYLKRLTPFVKVEIIELKDEGVKKESEKILNYVDINAFILDEKGKELSSVEFAEMIKRHEGVITFVIGGADGIENDVKRKSKTISLSKMTFVHEMARLFLIEQIYRSCMINSGRKYHR